RLAGGVGFPIPEELPLLAAGYRVWRGIVAIIPALAVCLVGVAAGDALLYSLGRLGWVRRFVAARTIAMVERQYARHGAKMLLAARFTPGLRSFFLLAAGAGRLPPRRFVPLGLARALVAALFWAAVGILCAAGFDRAVAWIAHAHHVAALALCAVAGGLFALFRVRKWLLRADTRDLPSHARSCPAESRSESGLGDPSSPAVLRRERSRL